MHDVLSRDHLADAQHQVPVLGPVELAAQSAQSRDQVTANRGEVTDVVLAQQQQRVEVGLEVGRVEPFTVGELVLVRVEQLRAGSVVQSQGHVQQRPLDQRVVVVHENEPLPRRRVDRRVGGRGDAAVGLAFDESHTRIAPGVLLDNRADLGIGRAVVGDDQLEVRVHLGEDGVDRGAQEPVVGVVRGHHDRQRRPVRQEVDALGEAAAQFVVELGEALVPLAVGIGLELAGGSGPGLSRNDHGQRVRQKAPALGDDHRGAARTRRCGRGRASVGALDHDRRNRLAAQAATQVPLDNVVDLQQENRQREEA